MAETVNQESTKPNNSEKEAGSVFYKITWYIVSGFLLAVFGIQLLSVPDVKTEYKATFSNFFNGNYQEYCENSLFKKPIVNELMKLKNKYEYLLFDKINLEDSYVGKRNYIFQETFTKAYFGDNYYGDSIIKDQVRKAKYVQDKLKEDGIELLVLFVPGKSSIYPEFLPASDLKTKRKPRNYTTYINECKNQKVNIIDFVRFFSDKKSTTQYPLFSKFGTHLSYFSEYIVVDTTIRKLEKLMNTNLPNIMYGYVKEVDTAYFRDGDIFLRTQMELPKGNVLAYPQKIQYERAVPQNIIGIGDSYLRCFIYLGALKFTFNNSNMWYYYNTIMPESPKNPEVWELDLKAEIMKSKAIVIMCNEVNLKTLGNGFIDDAYELFSNPDLYYKNKKASDDINRYKKAIRKNEELLSKLKKDSQQNGIPLDSLITITALKLKLEKQAN